MTRRERGIVLLQLVTDFRQRPPDVGNCSGEKDNIQIFQTLRLNSPKVNSAERSRLLMLYNFVDIDQNGSAIRNESREIWDPPWSLLSLRPRPSLDPLTTTTRGNFIPTSLLPPHA